MLASYVNLRFVMERSLGLFRFSWLTISSYRGILEVKQRWNDSCDEWLFQALSVGRSLFIYVRFPSFRAPRKRDLARWYHPSDIVTSGHISFCFLCLLYRCARKFVFVIPVQRSLSSDVVQVDLRWSFLSLPLSALCFSCLPLLCRVSSLEWTSRGLAFYDGDDAVRVWICAGGEISIWNRNNNTQHENEILSLFSDSLLLFFSYINPWRSHISFVDHHFSPPRLSH